MAYALLKHMNTTTPILADVTSIDKECLPLFTVYSFLLLGGFLVIHLEVGA